MKLTKLGEPLPISDLLPMLENFGLRVISERPYELTWPEGGVAWIQDFELERREGARVDLGRIETPFREAFAATLAGEVENDGFNRLLLAANLDAREIVVMRAYCKYLLQTGVPFSQASIERTLANNAGIAQAWCACSRPCSTLRGRSRRRLVRRRSSAAIRAALDSVASLDEDRILRSYLNLVQATLRTNFYQPGADGKPKGYVSFKLDPQKIPDLPLPRPKFEIFVYSPRVEGVHLRMGDVARGGLRWSDRREDFRTEVLGLMKAQNVKNTVIVPVGAKGGFFPKRLPSRPREAIQAEGIACYQTFIRALLDVTDNIVNGRVVPPTRVVRRDGDDPYLVVAADKGTATFSDIANAISIEYGFWLGDAFASGGSAGYDHKSMGITARGGWECVKRHFREIGVDIQSQDFTASGIGDMAGDVFGNGMLLSKHMRLQAAFNHQHIFLDPTPDAASSFVERQRLFNLPRSTWEDYDRKKISRGGGVYSRSVKSISLSPAAQSMLGLEAAAATPNEIIRAILRMPVDLLWNGGIGTYVKATDETNNDVGDRTNDAVRINGTELRAKVVGEGGNLGFSQRGRVEYALAGGRLNTDFIDNSAGVNTSDVEVNIKILLNPLMQAGKLNQKDRDKLLARMTDEVAALVLRNNYLQSQAISTLEMQSAARLAEYQHLIRSLERTGDLNRALEFLPLDEELNDRRKRGVGLTRPELSVVLSYSKIWLSNHLLASDVPEDPYLSTELERYFPAPVQERFPRAIPRHRLKREIITTATTNSLINRMGPTFVARTQEETGAEPADIARAYTAAREIFDMRKLWARIEALDNKVTASLQYGMMYQTSRLLRHVTYWLLSASAAASCTSTGRSPEFRRGVRELEAEIGHVLVGADRDRYEKVRKEHLDAGAPAELASRVACLEANNAALDIVELANAHGTRVVETARIYFEVGARTGLDWMRQQVEQLAVEGPWQAVARTGLRDNALRIHRRLAERVLRLHPASKRTRHRSGAGDGLGGVTRRRARALAAHAHRHADRRGCGLRNVDRRRGNRAQARRLIATYGISPTIRSPRCAINRDGGDARAWKTHSRPSRTEHLERRESLHGMARRRPVRAGSPRSGRSRETAARGEDQRRSCLHLGAEARHPHALDHHGRDGSHVGAGGALVAPQRAPLRRAPGAQQGADRGEARRGAGEDLAPELRHPAAAARARRSAASALRCALRGHRREAAACHRIAERYAGARAALLDEPHRAGAALRAQRDGRGSRQQPAGDGEDARQRVGSGDHRAEYSDRRAVAVRAGSGAAADFASISGRPGGDCGGG